MLLNSRKYKAKEMQTMLGYALEDKYTGETSLNNLVTLNIILEEFETYHSHI